MHTCIVMHWAPISVNEPKRPFKDNPISAVGSSLARVTFETSQTLLAGGHVVFLGDLPVFAPSYD